MLCWRTHETSNLTKYTLKTSGQFSGLFQFLSSPSPCLPPSLPPLQKPNLQTKTVKNAFETVSVFIWSIENVYQHSTRMGRVHCLTHSINDCLYKCCQTVGCTHSKFTFMHILSGGGMGWSVNPASVPRPKSYYILLELWSRKVKVTSFDFIKLHNLQSTILICISQ